MSIRRKCNWNALTSLGLDVCCLKYIKYMLKDFYIYLTTSKVKYRLRSFKSST